MSEYVYGIHNAAGNFITTAMSTHGAKCYASRNNYTEIYKMHMVRCTVEMVARYEKGRWHWVNQ